MSGEDLGAHPENVQEYLKFRLEQFGWISFRYNNLWKASCLAIRYTFSITFVPSRDKKP
jgi:hypothetical protein